MLKVFQLPAALLDVKMLNSVFDLSTLGVVESIKCADKIAGYAANSFKSPSASTNIRIALTFGQ
ncbi:hypothetical protein AXX12_10875 [Anaerosporomusa subterranea]|uniref:Uncharacterized protein n=1 Tax=Anaerosporomusa subterranea TaxID=1794912 RepID=A0A154BP95_ANASB|nr:hypothetical protein AXX12_10875 [Anaerosporomusa subterranea]